MVIWSILELRYATLEQLEKIRKRIEKFEKKVSTLLRWHPNEPLPEVTLYPAVKSQCCNFVYDVVSSSYIYGGGTSLNDSIGKILKAEA